MKPISFYINKQEEKRNHIALSGWYFLCAAKNLALSLVDLLHLIVKTIKRYPIHAITVTIIIAVIVCFVKIGQARIERDNYQHELYITKQKLQQYEIASGNINNRKDVIKKQITEN